MTKINICVQYRSNDGPKSVVSIFNLQFVESTDVELRVWRTDFRTGWLAPFADISSVWGRGCQPDSARPLPLVSPWLTVTIRTCEGRRWLSPTFRVTYHQSTPWYFVFYTVCILYSLYSVKYVFVNSGIISAVCQVLMGSSYC